MICPACNAEVIYFFGKTLKNRQRYVCKSCGCEFDSDSASPSNRCPR